jgi:aspartyl-tRNA(Asn)/glutamyl-tRNA(Gln) amidotransferase subunit A
MAAEPTQLTLAQLTRALRRRELGPLETVESFLRRIDELDGTLGTFVTLDAEGARAQARALERRPHATWRPLYGAPLAPKDLFATRGMRTTGGSKILSDWVPERDAATVRQLRDAGAIVLGKLNTHEFAFGGSTQNPWHGNTANPWDATRVPGGSSGGSGAAVAASLTPGSLVTDTGGSSRIPAHCCGVVGLKPTFGRLSRAGVVPLSWSLDHVGLMTKTVEDAGLLLDALAPTNRDDGLDPHIRLGVPTADFIADCESTVADLLEEALRALESLGVRVEPVALPPRRLAEGAQWAIMTAEAAAFHRRWIRERPGDYGSDVLRLLRAGAILSADDYLRAQQVRRMVTSGLDQAFREVDLIFLPVMPVAAPKLSALERQDMSVNGSSVPLLTVFTGLCLYANLSGVPALAVPCGQTGERLPIAFQLLAAPGRESLLLSVGRAYEREWSPEFAEPPL